MGSSSGKIQVSMRNTCSELQVLPKVRSDLGVWPLFERPSGSIFCIGSIELDRYIQVPESQLDRLLVAIDLIDGTRTICQIQTELESAGNGISAQQLIKLLSNAGLIENLNTSPHMHEINRLSIPLGSIKIDRVVSWLQPIARHVIKFASIFSILIILLALVLFLIGYIKPDDLFKHKSSYINGVIISSILLIPAFAIHETAHAFVAMQYKLFPKRVYFTLYFGFIPMVFLKIPGIYTVSRDKRILIMAAGVSANFTLAMLSAIVGRMLAINYLNNFAAANIQMAIFNLLPFALSDGYFIAMNLLQTPNLRMDMFKRLASIGTRNVVKPMSKLSKIYAFLSLTFLIIILVYDGYWLSKTLSEVLSHRAIHLSYFYVVTLVIGIIVTMIVLAFLVIRKRFAPLI